MKSSPSRDALALLEILKRGEEQVRQGKVTPAVEVFRRIRSQKPKAPKRKS
jgi:hypothetical protein